jgi:hypothetical protein
LAKDSATLSNGSVHPLFALVTLGDVMGNCDIDFLNFRHRQVRNFEVSNLYEQNLNFGVIFGNYQKRNRKSAKLFKTLRKPSVIPLKFCEMLLVS